MLQLNNSPIKEEVDAAFHIVLSHAAVQNMMITKSLTFTNLLRKCVGGSNMKCVYKGVTRSTPRVFRSICRLRDPYEKSLKTHACFRVVENPLIKKTFKEFLNRHMH